MINRKSMQNSYQQVRVERADGGPRVPALEVRLCVVLHNILGQRAVGQFTKNKQIALSHRQSHKRINQGRSGLAEQIK